MGRGPRKGSQGQSQGKSSAATRDDQISDSSLPPITTSTNKSSRPWKIKDGYRPSLSLQDEARYTETHRTWNPDLKLRHARIAFISVGHDQDEFTGLNRQLNGKKDGSPTNSPHDLHILQGESMAGLSLEDTCLQPVDDIISAKSGTENCYADRMGALESMHTGFPLPVVQRSPSPSPSNSSEEVIVFSGRNQAAPKPNKSFKPVLSPAPAQNFRPKISVMRPSVFQSHEGMVIDDPISDTAPSHSLVPAVQDHSNKSLDDKHSKMLVSSRSKENENRSRLRNKRDLHDEALADYISNIQNEEIYEDLADGTSLSVDASRTMESKSMLDEIGTRSVEHDPRPFPDHSEEDSDELDSPGLNNVDKISTSSDDTNDAVQIISKRQRPSGTQYLVVRENQSVHKAHWIPLSSLRTSQALEQVQNYEAQYAEIIGRHLSSNQSDDDYTNRMNAAIDVQDELDDIEDEQDILERSIGHMGDAKIARLLSKQEELGLGSNDLVIFDGHGYDNEDNFLTSLNSGNSISISNHQKNADSRRKIAARAAFEDSIDRNTYDGFDIMERNRSSLQEPSKGRHRTLVVEPNDLDTETALRTLWENDRAKKKTRRQAREKLHQLGLIGKKSKGITRAWAIDSISVARLKEEIKDFLKAPAESLSFPPMSNMDRRNIHQIANVLGLKSKSIGSGKSRFPVLHKTPRTVPYDSVIMDAILSQASNERITLRKDQLIKKNIGHMRRGRGGASYAAVSYRDGEIVGATAPELGQENKGRAMLEKMGWSTGTALGALNNKGIMQPLAQVVKTTKAGLG